MSLVKSNNPKFKQAGVILGTVLLSVALTLSILHFFPQLLSTTQGTIANPPAAESSVSVTPSNREHSFVAAVIGHVGSAVVRIDTERTVAVAPTPFYNDPFFRNFFGEDILPQLPREYLQRGQGSGFIIDRQGIILTNAHVVKGAENVSVTLRDGRTFQGKVRGLDEPSDLAVIKIDGSNLPVATLGSSAAVEVGDWAIAVGNPLGLDNTVTLGIISTLNRSSSQIGIPDKRLDFLQTDAAINPGNSGGPLLNQRGEVIGINTAMRADAQGIGFAIPIDKAKQIKDKLAKGEKVPHPYIGIRMIALTPQVAKQLNQDPNARLTAPEINGVLVVQVVPGSPAATAGIRPGDVITEVGGTKLTTVEQLQDRIEASRIGQPLPIEVRRGKDSRELTLRPAELQEAAQQ